MSWSWHTWLFYAVMAVGLCIFALDVVRVWMRNRNPSFPPCHSRQSAEETSQMTNFSEMEAMLQRLRNGPRRAPVAAGVSRYNRAVGYCEDTNCEDYAKGVFLLSHGPVFFCPRCRKEGMIMPETGSYTSISDVFKEVRIEYNFDPMVHRYRELAIVRDDSLMGTHNVYTLESPLIKTEKRALKVAESLLANLNSSTSLLDLQEGKLPRTSEFILHIDQDRETFGRSLALLGKKLEESNLGHRRGVTRG